MRRWVASAAAIAALALLAGCGEKEEPLAGNGANVEPDRGELAELTGTIRIASARVLQPLSNRAAARFEVDTPVEVEVEETDTATAFEKLCTERIDVAGARREMTDAEEAVCSERGIEVQRLKIANHAVAVATSEALGISCLTTDQLRQLWRPGSTVTRYSELGAGLPPAKVQLYGPETANDSFALFTALVNGRSGEIRSEWSSVVNRGAMTARLRNRSRALGFYNLAQLNPVTDIRLVAVDAGDGCIKPTEANVQRGSYPLQEDLFFYVSEQRLENLRLRAFFESVLNSYAVLAASAPSIVPASEEEIQEAERRLPETEVP